MALPSLCPEFETNLMSNRKVIELVLQLKSANAHGKNIKVKPHLVRHLLCNRLFRPLFEMYRGLTLCVRGFAYMFPHKGKIAKFYCFRSQKRTAPMDSTQKARRLRNLRLLMRIFHPKKSDH